jgi:hypothetical protein
VNPRLKKDLPGRGKSKDLPPFWLKYLPRFRDLCYDERYFILKKQKAERPIKTESNRLRLSAFQIFLLLHEKFVTFAVVAADCYLDMKPKGIGHHPAKTLQIYKLNVNYYRFFDWYNSKLGEEEIVS